MDVGAHWEQVYRTREPTEVSWYQVRPVLSLELLEELATEPPSRVIDVGGGASTLVDALLETGRWRVTVLDVSGRALALARGRLGEQRAAAVEWIEADVTRARLPAGRYDVWHDRAVFHFLVEEDDRRRYVAQAERALRPGGTLVVGTFALDGPTRCSGLPVVRYGADTLAAAFGDGFELVRGLDDVHVTPAGGEQRFTFAVLRRRG